MMARILRQAGAANKTDIIVLFEVSNLRAGDKTMRPGDGVWLNFLGPDGQHYRRLIIDVSITTG